jgi:LysR family glycine cleavage system transcriptional activator
MTRSRIPPLQTLRAFEAAVRLRSFTRAADELALTQGAISQHVRLLEAHIGVALFTRGRAGAEPTAHAHALALQVRQGLKVLERAFCPPSSDGQRRRTTAPPTQVTRLTLSALPALAAHWLAPRLHRFKALHPGIPLEIRPSTQLARLDGRDKVDVALRYGPGSWPGLLSDKLMDEEVFPVASPAYRNGRLPRRFADLAHCTLLLHTSQPWEPWFQAAKLDMVTPPNAPLFADTQSLLDAVFNGEGVALGRRSLIADALEDGRLVQLWKRSIIDVHAYYIVWRADSAKLAAIDALRAWLHSEIVAPDLKRTSVGGSAKKMRSS